MFLITDPFIYAIIIFLTALGFFLLGFTVRSAKAKAQEKQLCHVMHEIITHYQRELETKE